MESILKMLILIIILDISFGCTTNNYPSDFGFIVESEIETINSFDSTYTRRYRQGDSIVKIQFSSAELNDIYNSIIKNGLNRYPDNYSPSCESYIMPSFETKIQFRVLGEYKNLTSKNDCRTGFFKNRKNAKIIKSIKRIETIVETKTEVKRLSNTNIIFR